MNPREIITKAIEEYNPIYALLCFSGGHDSVVAAHISSWILNDLGVRFSVYHGNTSISIPETRQYVEMVCKMYDWDLIIGEPREGERYEDIVREYGFPGPGLYSHSIMYKRLKERALRHTVTHKVKSSPYSRENVLLISGARMLESKIRMGYKDAIKKEFSRVWVAPIFYFSSEGVKRYMQKCLIPKNKVKTTLGISGDCLCGCFSDKGEYDRIKENYPEVAKEINRLHKIAIDNGKPWFWTEGPNLWYKLHPKNQLSLDLGMCSNCNNIKSN